MLHGAGSQKGGVAAAIIGVVLALGVVVQLKYALNTIWEAKEADHAGIWPYLRTGLGSFAGILALGFLMAVSMMINATSVGVST